ncbi:MAG: ABC transporter ATP-binding protein [Thermoguttaceae bacterium]|jgi:putative ABC transport system ATP-binding protein
MTTNDKKNATEYAVETTELTKTYFRGAERFNAVDALELCIPKGEFVAMMGASGSGKSTALHLIAGLTRPSSGTVAIDGKDIFSWRDAELTRFRRRRIGVVFQSYNLIPHLTVEENILFPLRADGRKVDAATMEKLRALWRELELVEELRQYPDSLSGGERQRVALARAMATDPVVLLADEPTGNLDWTSSQKICAIFDRVNREESRTILLVTHEPAVAVWARRVVVLRDGQIVGDTPTNAFKDAGELAAYYQEIARGRGGIES